MLPTITEIIDVEYGGYRQWAIIDGYGAGDVIFYDSKIHHLHPAIPASLRAALTLDVPVGTRIAGIRWTDYATPEQCERFAQDDSNSLDWL